MMDFAAVTQVWFAGWLHDDAIVRQWISEPCKKRLSPAGTLWDCQRQLFVVS